jgi:RNA polymerase sigma-70 factor (ECF subfamily)
MSATHWSVVLGAGQGDRAAFGKLYVSYRPALLTYLRCKGNSQDKATELLQGFFEHLLERNSLANVASHGRFRSWLRTCLDHYVRDQWQRQTAQKRGGAQTHFPIGQQYEDGEVDPRDLNLSPEQAYDRKWAITLLKSVLHRLEAEYIQNDKQQLFAELKDFLPGGQGACSHSEISERLGWKVNTVTVAIKRLRDRFGELLYSEISDTVDPEMVDDEWRHLQQALFAR